MKRRDWLKLAAGGGAAALAAGGALPVGARSPEGEWEPRSFLRGRVRRVVFFVYDGLTWEDVGLLRYRAMREGRDPPLLERLLARGASGSVLAHSLTSVVTDSSAASSAWATGRKIVNQAVSQFPDGTRLTTILELARDRGLATGLITTTRMTHATPACWAAHCEHRDLEDEIALRYLDSGCDILLGGGSSHFDGQVRADGRDLFAEFGARGYEVVRSGAELGRASGSRLFGIFARDHLAYEIDRRHQGAGSPSLADLTRKGLEVLDGSERGFVVQIEAGRVDHANHQNDPGAALHDLLAAEEALSEAVAYVRRTPETLLMVTSDHGTGSGAIYGTGSGYRDSSPAFDRIGLQRASYQHFMRATGPRPARGAVGAAVREMFGIELPPERVDLMARVLAREERLGHLRAHRDQPYNGIHHVLTDAPPQEPGLNVHYATGQHTAGPVPLVLHGAGIADRGLGIVDNTELFGVMLEALGISWENPTMSEEEALSHLARSPGSHPSREARPHWA